MEILIRPLVTEKMTSLSEKYNCYGFIVHKNANKLQIKKAVEDLYSVTVNSINTIKYNGKIKSRFTKTGMIAGKRPSFKKAIVKLVEGDKIDFYSNI